MYKVQSIVYVVTDLRICQICGRQQIGQIRKSVTTYTLTPVSMSVSVYTGNFRADSRFRVNEFLVPVHQKALIFLVFSFDVSSYRTMTLH